MPTEIEQRTSESPVLTLIWKVLLCWFVVWAAVGAFVLSLDLQVPGGALSDMIFMGLAAALIFIEQVRSRGIRWAALAFVWVVSFGAGIEILGASTGWPFGTYHYTDRFGWLLAGVLPVSIPLAWWVVILPLFHLSRTLTALPPFSRWFLVPLFVASCAVWVDLLLEPVAWAMRGYWLWTEGGAYYGVPMQNFLGWFGVSWVLAAGLLGIEHGCGRTGLRIAPAPWGLIVLLIVILTFGVAALAGGYGTAALLGSALVIFLGGTLANQLFGSANRSGRKEKR